MRFLEWIKCQFKGHWYEHECNVHGDQINAINGMRSIWRCAKCGGLQYRRYLHYDNKRTKE